MKAEIITIGDEILIGLITDTNSKWISEQLNHIGIVVNKITSIGDNGQQIKEALSAAEKKSDIVLITGGLGPTKDDLTKQTLCEYFNTKLVLNEEVLGDVERFITSKCSTMNDLNRKQAEVPENCQIIRNYNGTAPVMWFEKNNTIFISMPGVPHEMKKLMTGQILPKLHEKTHNEKITIIRQIVLTTGVPEAHLSEILNEWETNLPEIMHLAYLPCPGYIRLRIDAISNDKQKLTKEVAKQIEKLKKIIPDNIIALKDTTLEEIIGEMLIEKHKTVSTAESCTGGNIAHLLTTIAGCSQYFQGSVVAYSNNVKMKLLNVSQKTLEEQGAVSQQTVEEMAIGVRNLIGTDYSVVTSGIAGPGGARPGKPVGTVWVAVASKNKVRSQKYNFGTDRKVNIRKASVVALNMLRILIKDD